MKSKLFLQGFYSLKISAGFILLFSIHFSLSAQVDRSNNLNIILGFTQMQTGREAYSMNDFQREYPQTGIANIDFSGYTFDSLSSHEVFALVPTSVAIEFGIPKKKSENSFFEKCEHRIKVWFQNSSFYENNQEKIDPLGMSGSGNELIHRNFYDVQLFSNSVGFTYGFHHHSNYKGKNRRFRLWFGLGIMNGLSFISGTVLQVEGVFEITDKYPAAHNAYYYPQTDVSFSRTINDYSFGKKILTGFEIPLGIEQVLGRKQRLHVGMEFSPGGAFLLEQGKELISAFYFSGGVNFRFQLRK